MKKSITKICGIALAATMAFAVMGCSQPTEEPKGSEAEDKFSKEFVKVPGGTVTGEERTSDLFPNGRKVTLSSFYMGKYEVTQAQYKSVMEGQKVTARGTEYILESSPSQCTGLNEAYQIDFGKDHSNYPVENVTWNDAVYYCNVLSAKENLEPCYTIEATHVSDGHILTANVTFDKTKNGYRLPTEAEWEYAARGGDPSSAVWKYAFSGADKAEGTYVNDSKNKGLDSVGWYSYNNITGETGNTEVTGSAEGKGTHEVGKKAPNSLGLYDMSGNVVEWCYDKWKDNYSEETVENPIGADTGSERTRRGGYWKADAYNSSLSKRSYCSASPQSKTEYLGFRVVRNAN